jgi:hypothetical protein
MCCGRLRCQIVDKLCQIICGSLRLHYTPAGAKSASAACADKNEKQISSGRLSLSARGKQAKSHLHIHIIQSTKKAQLAAALLSLWLDVQIIFTAPL